MVEVYEHYRPTTNAYPSGVYRVVGASAEITLLRVTDAQGRRAFTGEILHVSSHVLDTEFEAAANPDSKFSPIAVVRSIGSGLYWSVRRFL
ncbi:hypothetical protein [Haladaptatus caseinilyticus]|uniref:hypothetical protein n=1 Tax=Haladaptatus caseinilyticus TaxID=2993314 RepID=UPI00224B3122|nr:hypothetical protein [Haladaptatus caseinilyticus]